MSTTAAITAIIIDDEQHARNLLKGMLKETNPNVEILAEGQDLPDGVKAIRKLKPDVVFLDVEMPGHSGLELLDFFNEEEVDFEIIFTTAYNQYALRAFKLSAIDYLLKPIDPEELSAAIHRLQRRKKTEKQAYTLLKENLHINSSSKIAVPVGSSIRFIELKNILFLKADSSYTEINFTDGTKEVVSRTLKNFEEHLNDESGFFRCHKSYLINAEYITAYVKSDGGYILLGKNTSIPISPEKTQELQEKMKLVKR